MTTTNLFSGIGDKNSSRVLKPPGGGHSNIFGEPDSCPVKARPKYNQQNSSNLSHCVGTVDANEKVQKEPAPVEAAPAAAAPPAPVAVAESAPSEPVRAAAAAAPSPPQQSQGPSGDSGKGRVPPGGFSTGFW